MTTLSNNNLMIIDKFERGPLNVMPRTDETQESKTRRKSCKMEKLESRDRNVRMLEVKVIAVF